MVKSLTRNRQSVDQGLAAERKVFDFDAALEQMNGGMSAADFRIAEKIDLAIRGPIRCTSDRDRE